MFNKMKIPHIKITFLIIVSLTISSFILFYKDTFAQTVTCQVIDAKFRTNSSQNNPNNFMHVDNLDPQANNRPIIYLDIKTQNCIGGSIKVSVKQSISYSFDMPVTQINERVVSVSENNFTLVTRSGQDYCGIGYGLLGLGGNIIPGGWDCKYYISIVDGTGEEQDFASTGGGSNQTSMNLAGGEMLFYDCDGIILGGVSCANAFWQFPALNNNTDNFGQPMPTMILYGQSLGVTEGDQFNYVPINISYNPESYALAPLPGFPTSGELTLGDWLRAFFTLLIVVAGILAFIMIVIGGIRYATEDAVSGKSEGRKMIENAVLGLVLALGSWVILNTINPNLASNLSITIPTVYINPANEPETGIGTGSTGETITLDVVGGGTVNVVACDQTRMQEVTAFGKTFKIYEGLVTFIQAVDAQWIAAGGNDFYEIKSIGGYNCRKVKGTNTWSAHAFGVAVDINPGQNPFSPPSQNQLTTDMPPTFVQMWTSQGFGWGGAWTTLKDAMHFSKHPTVEGGNNIVTQ